MGMYDDVQWDAELPEGHPAGRRRFQTKSLYRCLECYTVTQDGRLISHPPGHEFTEQRQHPPVEPEGIDVEFHGDIRLVSAEGEYREYVARFTHGSLEWVKPLADFPQPYRSFATGRHLAD
jgi:hypothetical protein